MHRRLRSILIAAVAGALLAAAFMAVVVVVVIRAPGSSPGAEHYASAPASTTLPVLWAAPSFTLIDQHETSLSSSTFAGRPWIADFVFTTCTNACPLITSRMVLLQRGLADVDAAFVSFSVDPAHDTPAALAAYARRWNSDEKRWSLLATTPETLQAVAAGFRVTTEKTANPNDPILHSEVFFLVDGDGQVRSIANSHDSTALQRLMAETRRLATPTTPPAPAAVSLAALGCMGCHDVPQIAPPLSAMRATPRRLADGRTVIVDADYLRRAIFEPGADVVHGYPAIMPSYRAQLDEAQVMQLIDEILKRDAGPAVVDDVDVVIDPVCKMEVRADDSAPHADHNGKRLHFCAEVCRDAFVADPAKYAD